MYILCMYMVYTLFIDVCTCLHHYIELFCVQDTILVIPPYPFCIEEVPQDVLLEECWYARPQLLLPASSVHRGGDLQRIHPTDAVPMTALTTWSSSARLRS